VEFLDTLSANIALTGNASIRLVVIHTSAAVGPGVRTKELEAAMAAHVEKVGPCLVAGDFNCFAEPWLAPLLALPLAYQAGDAFIRERKNIEARFASLGFDAAVRGVTFPRWRIQMDQVFVRGVRLLSSRILRRQWGSDHRPILLELATGTAPARADHVTHGPRFTPCR
jgi:endonuclease/exonuclease/phosphatase (EEP) superfamily protein YafD